MMKNSTLFIVKMFNCNAVDASEYPGNMTGKVSNEMDSAVFGPSVQTIRRIMDFAHACSVMETKAAGHVEMNLN